MRTNDLIPADTFCTIYNIEPSFIISLHESGIIKIKKVERELYIFEEELPVIEKMLRLSEMDINIEGIETIHHLLGHLHSLSEEIRILKNRLEELSGLPRTSFSQ